MANVAPVPRPPFFTDNNPHAPTTDHVIPVSRGGSWEHDNLRVICRRCNSVRGAREAPPARPWANCP